MSVFAKEMRKSTLARFETSNGNSALAGLSTVVAKRLAATTSSIVTSCKFATDKMQDLHSQDMPCFNI